MCCSCRPRRPWASWSSSRPGRRSVWWSVWQCGPGCSWRTKNTFPMRSAPFLVFGFPLLGYRTDRPPNRCPEYKWYGRCFVFPVFLLPFVTWLCAKPFHKCLGLFVVWYNAFTLCHVCLFKMWFSDGYNFFSTAQEASDGHCSSHGWGIEILAHNPKRYLAIVSKLRKPFCICMPCTHLAACSYWYLTTYRAVLIWGEKTLYLYSVLCLVFVPIHWELRTHYSLVLLCRRCPEEYGVWQQPGHVQGHRTSSGELWLAVFN